MLGSRMLAFRGLQLARHAATRKYAAAAGKGKVYHEKSFKEAWCSDSGAYPVMAVIVFAVVFSLGYGVQVMVRHPDARISKGSRGSLFRGELKGTPLEE